MFLLDLLSARGICLACTNDHRLSWEIKEEKTPVLTRPGRRMWVGGRDSATRREAHFTCCLKIDISRFLRFLPCSATPAALRSWKSPNAVRAPLCFPTYGESPQGTKQRAFGEKGRCVGGVVSFAVIGGTGFGALDDCCTSDGAIKKAFYPGHVQCTWWLFAIYSPYTNILLDVWRMYICKWLPGPPAAWSREIADSGVHDCALYITGLERWCRWFPG